MLRDQNIRLASSPFRFSGAELLCRCRANRPNPGRRFVRGAWIDCLPNIRSYFKDLDAGARPLERSKIIVLGNGQVGKTQLRRWLLNTPEYPQPFDPQNPFDARHRGVRGPVAIPGADGTSSATIDASLWDFGGQDIYHGTHSLFMKTRAIFLLCWCPQQEDNREQELDGLTHQNRPMAYWLDYVRQLAGQDNPVIVVQTQCNSAADKQRRRFADLDLGGFESTEFLHFSAKKGTGGAALRAAIGEAAKWIKARHGIPLIGKGRMEVLDRLEGWRSEDSARPPAAREHKFLTQEDFKALCEDAGGISSSPHFLNFLHHAGVVFYRPGIFEDRIILDQDGALQAIYSVFNRKDCYRLIKRQRGRFTREMVAAAAWRDHGLDQQKLFLSMMENCGIAFVHHADWRDEDATEYVAPELLPERAALEERIESRWHGASEIVEERLRYPLLHHGLIRQILARIGREARLSAEYWKTGVLFYERHRQSDAMIEAVEDEAGWGGEIVISCRNGRAGELARLLAEEVEKIGASMGLTPGRDPSAPAPDERNRGRRTSRRWNSPASLRRGRNGMSPMPGATTRKTGRNATPGSMRCATRPKRAGSRSSAIATPSAPATASGRSWSSWSRATGSSSSSATNICARPIACSNSTPPGSSGRRTGPCSCTACGRSACPAPKSRSRRTGGKSPPIGETRSTNARPISSISDPRIPRNLHLARQFALNVGEILFTINDTITPRDWDAFLDWAFSD